MLERGINEEGPYQRSVRAKFQSLIRYHQIFEYERQEPAALRVLAPSVQIGTSVRRSSGWRSDGQLLAMT